MTALSTAPAPATWKARPLRSLAKAEYLQFKRNKTLVYTGILAPVGSPLLLFFGTRDNAGDAAAMVAIEAFVLAALVFLQFYSVLSMVTTRRAEGVLKRLRTGEAPDWKIQAAPAVPGLVLTLIGAVAVPAVVYATGVDLPVNPVALLVALLGGLAVFALLALATSGLTKNAEAAQITSLPVMILAIAGMSSIRSALPENAAAVLDWTPFAAVSDLIALGTMGRLPGTDAADALGFAGTFGEFGRPVVTLVLWTILALVLTRQYFRWDDRG